MAGPGKPRWMKLLVVASRIGGGRMPKVEEVLNDLMKSGRIEHWKFVGGWDANYEVLTAEDITALEAEIISAVSQKIRGRG